MADATITIEIKLVLPQREHNFKIIHQLVCGELWVVTDEHIINTFIKPLPFVVRVLDYLGNNKYIIHVDSRYNRGEVQTYFELLEKLL